MAVCQQTGRARNAVALTYGAAGFSRPARRHPADTRFKRRHRDEPGVRAILERLTVHTVPMLNPDGAERWQRRNVQSLDLNRDALLLQSAEGQLLKRLRDELLVRAFHAIADGSAHRADTRRYDSLPENESFGFYYLVKHVTIRLGSDVPPFTGDVGIGGSRPVLMVDGRREVLIALSVADLGDLRTHVGLFEIDGTGKVLAAVVEGATEGGVIATEAFEAQMGRWQTGSAANLMLLGPAGAGYRVERVFAAALLMR